MVLLRFVEGTFCPGNRALWPWCPAAGRMWGWGEGGRRHDASCCQAWCQAVQRLPLLLCSSPEKLGDGRSPVPSGREKGTLRPQQPTPPGVAPLPAECPVRPARWPQLHSNAPPHARSGFSKPLRFRQTGASATKKPQSVSTAFAQCCRPIRIARSLYPALRGQVLPTIAVAWRPY